MLLPSHVVAAPRVFLGAFVADAGPDAALFVEVGARLLLVSCAWQVFDPVGMVLSEALRAAGDTLATFVARAALAWGLFVPGAWASVHVFGAGDVGAAAWLVAYLGLLALVLGLRFRGGRWRTIELTAETPL